MGTHQDSLHQFRGSYDFMAAEGERFVHEILMSFVLSGVSPDFNCDFPQQRLLKLPESHLQVSLAAVPKY